VNDCPSRRLANLGWPAFPERYRLNATKRLQVVLLVEFT
jgi:hypothetical protein